MLTAQDTLDLARAIQRCGVLLKQVKPARGENQNIRVGVGPNVPTRKGIASAAGLSDRRRKGALRVASIAANPQICGDSPGSHDRLPASWTMLYELSRWTEPEIKVGLAHVCVAVHGEPRELMEGRA